MRKLSIICICSLIFCLHSPVSEAVVVYDFQIFTTNGNCYDDPEWNLYVEVVEVVEVIVEVSATQVDFTFYNESSIESSIARIYFDNGSLLGIAGITSSPGVSFSQPAKPKNLPSGNTLEPPFVTTVQFSIDSDPPVSKNGVNPGEWLRITFDINGGTFAAVIDGLNTGTLRIGTHIIALPNGSSESAIAVPEPATIGLLGLGALSLIRRRSTDRRRK